jgi:hypothetical protein
LDKHPRNGNSSNDAESGQEELVEKFHTECHPVVFGEIDVEPVGDFDTFVPIHMGLHPNLDDLVDDEHTYYDECRELSFCENFLHSVFVFYIGNTIKNLSNCHSERSEESK